MERKPFVLLNTKNKEYKLKFSSGAIAQAEQSMGMSFFKSVEQMDSVSVQLAILWAALQKFNHGISKEDTEEIYNDFLDNGGTLEDLVKLIVETFEVSGFIPKQQAKPATKKRVTKK